MHQLSVCFNSFVNSMHTMGAHIVWVQVKHSRPVKGDTALYIPLMSIIWRLAMAFHELMNKHLSLLLQQLKTLLSLVWKKSENGVKGFSWCVFIPKFDIIRGCAIDYMHGTLLGVVKMLLTLWLNNSHSKQPWSLSSQIAKLDSRYLKMTPPACITRLPRSLASNFGHLKASELRTFLLFYSIPCLYGLLPEIYFQHYILLVSWRQKSECSSQAFLSQSRRIHILIFLF